MIHGRDRIRARDERSRLLNEHQTTRLHHVGGVPVRFFVGCLSCANLVHFAFSGLMYPTEWKRRMKANPFSGYDNDYQCPLHVRCNIGPGVKHIGVPK